MLKVVYQYARFGQQMVYLNTSLTADTYYEIYPDEKSRLRKGCGTNDIPKILLRSVILNKVLKETLTHRMNLGQGLGMVQT